MPDKPMTDVLLVEDTMPLARVYMEYLRHEPYHVSHVETGKAALDILRTAPPRAIILDLKLPDMDSREILEVIRDEEIPCTAVVITAHGSVNTAVEAMRLGAADFILKPFSEDRLVYTMRNALERRHLAEVVEAIAEDRRSYCGFVGASLPMQAIYRVIDQVAPSKVSVFITGETGTGKEVCADAIHRKSPRRDGPFVAINCAAIPHELMESEMFGHVKGAFTGAMAERDGAASLAHGGTLFLDEICDMDLAPQAKLLRFVQTGVFQKVGSSATREVDVRIVCTTNKSPWREVEAGRFREDLYFRLHVVPLHLPPLRERGDDIHTLAGHFLETFAGQENKTFEGFTEDAKEALARHPWPGNVRELANAIHTAVVLNHEPRLSAAMLSMPLRTGAASWRGGGRETPDPARATAARQGSAAQPDELALRPMRLVEWDYIREALRTTGNDVPRVASILELSPSTIYRRIREFRNQAAAE